MAEFKIGRLRFNYLGQWATETFYNRDAMATFEGKTYVCLVPHTSGLTNGAFYDALNYVTPGGASTPYWDLVLDGQSWVGPWQDSTFYSLGNLVSYGGSVYICTAEHTSDTVIDNTKFQIYNTFSNWQTAWQTNFAYGVGDIVKYGGTVYLCNTNHISASTTALGLETDQSKWTVLVRGIEYKTNWQSSERYKQNDIVKNGPDLWLCEIWHQAGSLFDSTKWSLWLPGVEYLDTWNSGAIYQPGDVVVYGGYSYVSNTINNTSNTPSAISVVDVTIGGTMTDYDSADTIQFAQPDIANGIRATGTITVVDGEITEVIITNPGRGYLSVPAITITTSTGSGASLTAVLSTYWSLLTTGYNMRDDWTSSNSYRPGDIVRRGGNLYEAIQDNSSEDPTNFGVTVSKTSPAFNWNLSNFGGSIVQGPLNGPGTYAAVMNFSVPQESWEIVEGWPVGQSLTITINGSLTSSYTTASPVSGSAGSYSVLFNDTFVPPGGTVTAISFTMTYDVGNRVTVQSTTGIVPGMIISGTGVTQGQLVVSVTAPNTVYLNDPPNSLLVSGQSLKFLGVNYQYWKIVNISTNWTSFWDPEILYQVGDLVVWGNTTYKCIQTMLTSTNNVRPDQDTTNSYWVTFVRHDRRNAGQSIGDIATGAGNSLNTNIGIGTEDYVLGAEGSRPEWKKILTVPAVYYVTPNGVDNLEHGDSWDKPWASIKFACEQILKGRIFQNGTNILLNNKEFLVEEMYQWMLYQVGIEAVPFTSSSVFDEFSTKRDARYIIDALIYDLSHGSNSRTVFATLAFFAGNSSTTFRNEETDAAQPYIVAALTRLSTLISQVMQGQTISPLYQELNGITTENITPQDTSVIGQETGADIIVYDLLQITIDAISQADTTDVPLPDQGLTNTIMVKTGTYYEELPISIPDNTAINGDELRGAVVRPKVAIYTSALSSSALTNEFTLATTEDITAGIPIQFSVLSTTDIFSGVVLGQTYYVKSINGNNITISETVDGDTVVLSNGAGLLTVYAGDCLKDMFYVRNATGIRNMTLTGLAGSLTAPNSFGTRRPTGGAYVSLDPGTGPDDTNVWISRRSPYIQNVTNFGVGCTGLKIDGYLHNGGNKSIVCNDFTQILSDGIGVWCTGPQSLTECVSVFSYYNYAGYFAEDGGRIRATNGNSSYGSYGVIAEGFDVTETPISAQVDNQSTQVQAGVQSAFGTAAQLLSMQYSNAGSGYNEQTTNLLRYSNNFDESVWVNDGNLNIQQNTLSPFGRTDAWTLIANTSSSDSSYLYQEVAIAPAGRIYTNLPSLNITGSGQNATFDVTVNSTSYTVQVNTGGQFYVNNSQLRILGSQLGGRDGVNDCFLLITGLAGSAVLNVTASGTVPIGSAKNYTASIYAKKGTASSIDLVATFSGDSSSVSSSINFNFDTEVITPSNNGTSGLIPTIYNKLKLENGWYRIWLTTYDSIGLHDTLQVRVYPRGITGFAGYTRFYGSQLQGSSAPTFYLTTNDDQFTSNADFSVTGAGTGVITVGDEVRTGSTFEVRVTDTGLGAGGRGYLIASNNAQGGDDTLVILAGADENTSTNYVGMRVFLQSGTGAGQYGYISNYTPGNKYAQVLKESFKTLVISSTNTSTDELFLDSGETDSMYVGQLVQFIPTYYSTNVTATSVDSIEVLQTIGGVTNTIIVVSTAKLVVNAPIIFSGNVFGAITSGFTYYVKEIVSGTTFTISSTPFGTQVLLTPGTPGAGQTMTMTFSGYNSYITGSTDNMTVNMPISFTGTQVGGIAVGIIYYVNEVINETTFTIASTLLEFAITSTAATTNYITTSTGTNGLVPLNPIVFSGPVYGGIVAGTKYYIDKIINSTTFTITSSLIKTRATATEVTSNLITVISTEGFIVNNPVIFRGNTVGGIVNETVYYILVVNDETTFTVSLSPSGSAINLSTTIGDFEVFTTPAAVVLTNASGINVLGTTTNNKTNLSFGTGSMNGTYSTSLFGNVVSGTTYYVKTLNTNSFTISGTLGGPTFNLKSDIGSMNVGEVGWDHINPGTVIASNLDSSTVYYIEPRLTFSDPDFTQSATTVNTISVVNYWNSVAYGEQTIIGIPNGSQVGTRSINGGSTWTELPLPVATTWTDIAYGNGYWVIISNDKVDLDPVDNPGVDFAPSRALYSNSNGIGWRETSMPNNEPWENVIYGNGKFVAVAKRSNSVAYSTDYGYSWSLGTGTISADWTGIAYGAGRFIAVASGFTYEDLETTTVSGGGSGARFTVISNGLTYSIIGTDAGSGYSPGTVIRILGTSLGGATPANDLTITITEVGLGGAGYGGGTLAGTPAENSTVSMYSTDGITWTSSELPINSGWSDVTFGNGTFVVVSSSGDNTLYSQDGITWSQNIIPIGAVNKIAYGQGVFLAVSTTSGTAYTSEDGINWITRAVSDDEYRAVTFAYEPTNTSGRFITLAGQNTGSIITAGTKTKGRVSISSGRIIQVTLWEPGSNYITTPVISLFDPNISIAASLTPRTSNGTLANPTFINRGEGYNTNSTTIAVNGGGYADTFQTGIRLIVKDLTTLPGPGDNLTIAGNPTVYKVTQAEVVFGTTAPNIKANLQVSPDISIARSPSHNTAISIRTKYSQARLTGHDFLNVGYGNAVQSNYPGVPEDTVLAPQDQAVEVNFGRVFYTSTDQDGNFKVGDLFGVEQATGIVTLSASQFGLTGLETLSLGGISVGGSSVVVRQFSTDQTFIANSNEVIPTQRAIKAYLNGRLSQGGSNTFTGQLIAGTVLVGGPNRIGSTIPAGIIGSSVQMPTLVEFSGQFGGWDGDGMAMAMFMKSMKATRTR
jgi:hypothetical protein